MVGSVDRRAYVRHGWMNVRMASSFCQGARRDCWIFVNFVVSSSMVARLVTL